MVTVTGNEGLPPRWLESMRERRACLFRYQCEVGISAPQAEGIALDLAAKNGTGRWECRAVRLDDAGRDWEFRFRPQLARVVRFRGRSSS